MCMAGQSTGIRMRAHAVYIARLRGSPLRSEFHSRAVSRVLPEIVDGWVVDIGCGPGLLGSRILAARPDVRTVGIDVDPEMLRVARAGTGVRVVRATSDALPFRTGSIQVAVSTASLKDWGDRRGGLAEIRRIVRPGGVGLVGDFVTAGPGSSPVHFRRRFGLVSDLLRRFAGFLVPFSGEDAARLAASVGGTTELDGDLGVVWVAIRPSRHP